MITVASLKNYSLKDLAQLARKSGIEGWQSMRKEQLIRALGKTVKIGNKEPSSRVGSAGKPSQSGKASGATKASSAKEGGSKAAASKSASAKGGAAKGGSAKAAGPKPATKSGASAGGKAATQTAAARLGAKPSAAKPSIAKTVTAKKGDKLESSKTTSPKSAASKSAATPKASKAVATKTGSSKSLESVSEGKADQARDSAKNELAKPATKPAAKAAAKAPEKKPAEKPRLTQASRKIQRANEERERRRDLSQPAEGKGSEGQGGEAQRDRVVLIVRDPYWLQATWEVTRQSVLRAQAAMAEQWHTARPILRLLEIESSGTTSSAERVLREIPIHGGVHNWYIDVIDPPKGYRVELGYLGANGKFFVITRSNTVTTPRPGSADSIDENWSDVEQNFERIFAQSGGYSEETSSHELQEAIEEKLQRPIGPPISSRFGVGAERILRRRRDFQFDVDAEMVVHGQTKPDAHVTLSGEPVKLRDDGSFAVRMALPDKRQVIPVVASSRDGGEQRTIVIAVERNTKVMEPMIRESND
ncbi:MAG: DUF4912 domain-containing protein [Pirellulales bacterium]